MKLYYTKRSPYARKIRIIALEKNIKLEFVDEDLMNKSSVLLKANPVGKIPTLVLDNGEPLADSPVICEYLDSLPGNPVFIPKSGQIQFRVLYLAAMADGLTDVLVAIFYEKRNHPDDFNAKYVAQLEETVGRSLVFFNDRISEFKDFNLASAALISAVGYLRFRFPQLYDAKKFSALDKWLNETTKRPSVEQTVPVG